MKKNIIYIMFGMASFFFTSCEKWFDVTSSSEIREKDHYSTVTGFQQSLIGCYTLMTDDNLYGKELSWFATELMAHQFNPYLNNSSTSEAYHWQDFSYSHTSIVSEVDGIWEKSYNVIANANEALKYIDEQKNSIDEINYHVIKGELLSIRAYMHFDLLRLFGYGNWENRSSELNSKLTVPYQTELSKTPAKQLSGSEMLTNIINDLSQAEELLKDYDPITGKHDASFYEQYNEEGFFLTRTLRLNYYAVKALKARVYMWQGGSDNYSKALIEANDIISAVGTGINNNDMRTSCYMLTSDQLTTARTSLFPEYLFGLNVSDLSTRISDYIVPQYMTTNVNQMFLTLDDAEQLYDNSSTDTRLSILMYRNTIASTQGYVPLKVYQGYSSPEYQNKVSMIRLPEVYLIAAECYVKQAAPDIQSALNLINYIRQARGVYEDLSDLTVDETLNAIKKEYRKEFLSEGVMFYYYKRTGETTIPNFEGSMSDAQYLLPYPAFEIQSGRVQ